MKDTEKVIGVVKKLVKKRVGITTITFLCHGRV